MANVVSTLNDNIRKAYHENINRLDTSAEQGIEQLHTTTEKRLKEIREKTHECMTEIKQAIQEARNRENRFFTFDSVKSTAFYISCCFNIIAFILLIYFLFFK
jgi:ElaB/YqjD/DUF883 family membrane-anchored ribosome-binding protein